MTKEIIDAIASGDNLGAETHLKMHFIKELEMH